MNRTVFIRLSLTACWLHVFSVMALSPAELKQKQAEGEKITIIDVRSNEVFTKGHIPGAINIPASLMAQKKLPPIGKVVVYDDGLGRDVVNAAVVELNKKPGIQAEVLDGGFAEWENSRGTTAKAQKLEPEKIAYITYQELKAASVDEIVLVDLRTAPVLATNGVAKRGVSSAVSSSPTSNLSAVFPGARITKSPFDLPQARQSSAGGISAQPLLVLIDNGDGKAQEMARRLKAKGSHRVVILAGGETIIARDGQPGLQRRGLTPEGAGNSVTK